jgi:triacylglycerol esterase/lipase EstA (alpha/beta hydrolase family)
MTRGIGTSSISAGDNWRIRMRVRIWRALLGVVACAASMALLASTAGAATLRVGNFGDAITAELFTPGAMPPGSNPASCTPSAAHPYPVILVHGTLANEAFSWQALSPMLVNAGYCVYAFNYGANGSTLGHFYGLTDIAASAGELSTEVNNVLAATKATKVDLVGHSQGGMMPRYYIKNLGGAAKVNMLVGLAPSNHGTTLDGLNALVNDLTILGVPAASLLGCVSCTQQIVPSSFITALNSGTETPSGPKYVVIESRYDEVVTPYTSAFLSGSNVQNILLQNQCAIDFSDHIGIIYDPVALQDVMNALGANSSSFRPSCSLVLPVVG